MDEKTVADLWDAIKGIRDDIAALQDRMDYHEERQADWHERHQDQNYSVTHRLGDDINDLYAKVDRLERSR